MMRDPDASVAGNFRGARETTGEGGDSGFRSGEYTLLHGKLVYHDGF